MIKTGWDRQIETVRLILQPVSDKYKKEICDEFTTEVTTFMPFTPNGNIMDTEAFIQRSKEELKNGTAIHFCIIKKESNEFLGCCGLHDIDTSEVEIGLWLKTTIHRKGYGTETVGALVKFAEEDLAVDYIIYPVDKDNIPSRKIPEKLGFRLQRRYEKKKSETEILHIVEYRKQVKHEL